MIIYCCPNSSVIASISSSDTGSGAFPSIISNSFLLIRILRGFVPSAGPTTPALCSWSIILPALLKPIENLAKVLIILLCACGGTMIFQQSVFKGFSIINFVIFAILIFVFTKIFNILFKLKLKV